MLNLLSDSSDSVPEEPRYDDIEMGRDAKKNSVELVLDDFFKQVKAVDKQINKLSVLLKKLQNYDVQNANEEYKVLTKTSSMNEIRSRMSKDIEMVMKTAIATKSKIENMYADGTGMERSRTASTVALNKKFLEKMSEFQTLRNTIHQEHKEVVERRVFTVTGNHIDEETIEQLIKSGQSEQIFQNAIEKQGRGQMLDTLTEIQERHDTAREIESKLLELRQVFLDMSVLVETQGDMLDNIESQVVKATDYVQSGTVALQKSKSIQKSTRKWTCIAIIILLVIIIIVVIAVLKPWKKSDNNNTHP
ncbi:putative Syntaxin [Zostera marina]|uniref:Putative Syntaxin n=1 Tax=Zostera marina TaxID=29655 RepID=A0A0K9PEY7_ZOSMR|nr:putative Syntaxin [Zostera marina]